MEHERIEVPEEDETMPTGRELLFDILSWARPHESQIEIAFCKEYLDTIPGMQCDEEGNRFIRIGEAPVLWSCHVDTVDAKDGQKAIFYNRATGLASLGGQGKPGQCLGADDGSGVWLLLEMLRRKKEGLYVFHRGEERGCIGSSWIAKYNAEFLDGIQMAIAFDRKSYSDVITYQASGRCCSDTFAKALGDALNAGDPGFKYKPDDTGLYTDTNEYTEIVPECTNLSVGYSGAHGPRETLDVPFLERLLDAVMLVDTSALPIVRDPSVYDSKWSNYGGFGGSSWMSDKSAMYRKVYAKTQLVADFLEEAGITVEQLETYEKIQAARKEAATKEEKLTKKGGVVLDLLPEHIQDANESDSSASMDMSTVPVDVAINNSLVPIEDENPDDIDWDDEGYAGHEPWRNWLM